MAGEGDTTIGGAAREFPRTTLGLLDGLLRPAGREGFEELCRRYWKPVYSFIRIGWAKSNDDAKDLTQQFFAWLFESDVLRRYESDRASFRTFVKALVRGFVADHHKALGREKRGGTARVLSLDGEDVSLEAFLSESQGGDPDRVFDQAWLMSLLAHAVAQVRKRCSDQGRLEQFEVFDAYDLSDGPAPSSYRDVGSRLGRTEGQVRDILHALRREVRAEIRAELLRQTRSKEEFDEEWNALLGA
jgi:RNA polymerase sigma-70 factor (ECF subfamily)